MSEAFQSLVPSVAAHARSPTNRDACAFVCVSPSRRKLRPGGERHGGGPEPEEQSGAAGKGRRVSELLNTCWC